MDDVQDQEQSDVTLRAVLGLCVLALAICCANITALPIDSEAFTSRLADPTIRHAFTVGYVAQIGTGVWLALLLLLDIRRSLRLALVLWLAALCLFLAPVPTLREAPFVALLPFAVVLFVAMLGWLLDGSIREHAV